MTEEQLKEEREKLIKESHDHYVAVPAFVLSDDNIVWEIVTPKDRKLLLEYWTPPEPYKQGWWPDGTAHAIRFVNQEAAEDFASALTVGRNRREAYKIKSHG